MSKEILREPDGRPIRKANRWFYGLGTVGRDFLYTLVSIHLVIYAQIVFGKESYIAAGVGIIAVIVSIVDALNDPFMGMLVDNTKTRWGKYKPWILFGGAVYGALSLVLFSGYFGLSENPSQGVLFLVLFAITYFIQEIMFTTNDIGYLSLVPDLTKEPRERNVISAYTRIFANIGAFAAIGVIPMLTGEEGVFTNLLGTRGDAYALVALIGVVLMLGLQCFCLFGVKEPYGEKFVRDKSYKFKDDLKGMFVTPFKRVRKSDTNSGEEKTTVKDIFKIIFKNKQLLVVVITMTLFMAGYNIIALNGSEYFRLVYNDTKGDWFFYFSLILAGSQILGLVLFPLISKKVPKKFVFLIGMISMAFGFLFFFFIPKGQTYFYLAAIAAFFIFIGQSFIQALMMVFISDCVEYGEFQFKRRNAATTFAAQPIIYKFSNAIAKLVYTVMFLTPLLSGVLAEVNPAPFTKGSQLLLEIMMMIIPVVLIAICTIVFMIFYKLDEKKYQEVLEANIARRKLEEEAKQTESTPESTEA